MHLAGDLAGLTERGSQMMDTTIIQAESLAAIERADKKEARTHKMFGAGPAAQTLSELYFDAIYDALPGAIERGKHTHGVKGLMPIVATLDPRKVSLVALQGTMQSIAACERFGATCRRLGTLLEDEAYAAGLTTKHPKLAQRLALKARQARGGRGRRVKMTKAQADAAGFKVPVWSRVRRVKAGGWLLDMVMATLPDVFVYVGEGDFKCVFLTSAAIETSAKVMADLIDDNYSLLPMAEAPVPWTGFDKGGAPHFRASVIRTHFSDTKARVAAAIKSGQMRPALDGLNALQATAWKLNTRMAGIIRECARQGLLIKGMPRARMAVPEWDDTRDAQEQAIEFAEIRKHNQRVLGDTLTLQADLKTADLLADRPRWHTPMNLDFRGRVYALTQFCFARDDRVRSMFLFADGEPLGEDGLKWLMIHVANTGAFDRVDKQPLDARIAWVTAHTDRIKAMCEVPMRDTWWHQADKPFLFLAACFELISAITAGPQYVCHLPVSFDGTCSGLQHLCLATRAPEGALVNLTPSPLPSDVYAQVASRVATRLTADASRSWPEDEAWKAEIARLALTPRPPHYKGCDRSFVKRATMTYSYSSKPHGMAGQLVEDLMRPLQALVVSGELDEHPFGPEHGRHGTPLRPGPACRYLAKHIYDAIGETVSLPAKAMTFLQQIARALAHERKVVTWVTPVGIPWVNRYHNPTTEIVELWMYDAGVRVRMRTEVATGDEIEVSKEKAANAVAPNWVHALDAAHLLRVASAHHAGGGGPIATVHDSFGCLPSRAGRFNQVIREELIRMYTEHDPLVEVLDQATHDLTPANRHKLPSVPQRGSLDLEGIRDATFAFS